MTRTTDSPTRPAAPAAVSPFPYQRLLDYFRGQVHDPAACEEIEQCLTGPDPKVRERSRAHLDSIQYLDLERAAALQDGEELKHFSARQATEQCRAVAATGGAVFDALIRGGAPVAVPPPADAERQATSDYAGAVTPVNKAAAVRWARKVWADHVRRCAYCRRMRRLRSAEWQRAKNSLPEGELLLRDWLLLRYYQPELVRLTRELGGVFVEPGRDPSGAAELPSAYAGAETPYAGAETPVEDSVALPGRGASPGVPAGEWAEGGLPRPEAEGR